MDEVDFIIDNSKSEDEAIANIIRHARAIHGDATVDSYIDSSATEDEAKTKLVLLARKPRITKESQPLVDFPGLRDLTTPDQIYGGLKTATVVAKPLSFMTTPITEAVRAIPKWIAQNVGENTSQTPPIDTAAEYKSVLPSDRAGLGLLTRDMANAFGIQSQPQVNIESQDYPKMAEFLTQLTDPTNIAGAVADTMVGAKLPVGQMAKNAPITIEAAADYLRSIARDRGLLGDLEKSGRIYELAKMVQTEPEKYLRQFRPKKIYSQIMGDVNPPEGSRLLGNGELSRMNNYQNDLIETIPQDVYSIPREELQASALAELGKNDGLEYGQRTGAEQVIRNNIPVMQPDPVKIAQLNNYTQKLKQLQDFKNSTSPKIPNPMYREDLQWLSGLPVVDDLSGNSIFPKQRMMNETTITAPRPEYTPINPTEALGSPGTVTGFEPSGKVISPDSPVNIVNTESIMNTVSDPINSLKNQKLLDIAQGKQLAPQYVENLDRSNTIGSLSQEIDQLRDPSLSSVEDYMSMMRARNEEPIGYASKLRRLGNKLMEPAVPGEVSTDVASKNLAGRAIERAARNAQEQAMGFMPNTDKIIYDAQNRKISNLLNMRDLTQGNLTNSGVNLPAPGGMTGKTGLIAELGKGIDRYVKPTIQPIISDISNTPNILVQRPQLQLQSASQSAGEFMVNKNGVNLYKIPRSTEELLKNPAMVKAKVEREFGAEMANAIVNAKTKEELSSLMINLTQLNPNAFEQDAYGRFDGQIVNPILKQKAAEQIINNEASPLEGAKKMQLLMNGNKYYGQ